VRERARLRAAVADVRRRRDIGVALCVGKERELCDLVEELDGDRGDGVAGEGRRRAHARCADAVAVLLMLSVALWRLRMLMLMLMLMLLSALLLLLLLLLLLVVHLLAGGELSNGPCRTLVACGSCPA